MRYFVALPVGADAPGTSVAVDVVERPNGTLQVHVDGRPVEVDAVTAGRQLSVRVGGRIVDLTTHGRLPDMTFVQRGQASQVRVESERTRGGFAGSGRAVAPADKVVASPMPGRVVRVLVIKGERVRAGQGLVVLEAMKMENEVRARTAGEVAEVHVTEGETVEGRAKLVSFL